MLEFFETVEMKMLDHKIKASIENNKKLSCSIFQILKF